TANHNVSLGGIALEMHGAWYLHDWSRRGQGRQPTGSDVGPARRLERLDQCVVLDIACGCDDDLLRMIGALVKRTQVVSIQRTHVPNATDRTPGMCSESTVSPFGRTVRRRSEPAACAARVTRANDLPLHRRCGHVRHVRDAVCHRGRYAPNAPPAPRPQWPR